MTLDLIPYAPPVGGYPAGRLGHGEGKLKKWYYDPIGARHWRSVTEALRVIETDTYNLDRWKERQIVEGMSIRPDLVQLAISVGRAPETREGKDTLNTIAWKASQAAKVTDGANLGTAMHNMTEAVDRGADPASFPLPEPYRSALLRYAELRRVNGYRSVEIERTVRIPELDWCGSFDRIDTIEGLGAMLGGGPDSVIVDVKTEAEPWKYGGMKITGQLASYAHADAMWVPGVGWVEMPEVRRDVAVVINVRDGDAVPYFVNIGDGWRDAQRAAEQIAAVSAAKIDMGNPGARFAPMPYKRPTGGMPMLPITADAAAREAAGAGWANPARPPDGGAAPARTFATVSTPVEQLVGPGAMATHRALVEQSIPKLGDTVTVGGIAFMKHTPTDVDAAFGLPAPVTDTTQLPDPNGGSTWSVKAAVLAVWSVDDRAQLAELYDRVTGAGLAWVGAIEVAGASRLRMIECPQRGLHSASSGGMCACGWTSAVRP
jgi:hypothetical protein